MNVLLQTVSDGDSPVHNATICPRKLASLDVGLVHHLTRLGTSPSRICATMGLTEDEYRSVCQLRG